MTPRAGFEDDVAVLIYRHPPDALNVDVTVDDRSCLATIRARLRRWLPAAAIAARDGADILIAVGEAAANAFEHAPAGRGDRTEPVRITVTARAVRAAVEVTVADTGTWRPPRPEPGTRGHGMTVMNALMDAVTVSTAEHGTTVTMTKEL
jgi:anti-sigma regulatory factor (Ser/Thr protein kinase)